MAESPVKSAGHPIEEEEGSIKWLFHKTSEKGVLPPTLFEWLWNGLLTPSHPTAKIKTNKHP